MNDNRSYISILASQYINAGKPTEWFEHLYAEAIAGNATIPWADMQPNPNLIQWLDQNQIDGQGKTALKVGCGLGDDVEALCQQGFKVVGFDIAASAIDWCHRRWPSSTAQYWVADVLNPPESWTQAFDFVLESYTLQVLPPPQRQIAIRQIANFVALAGQLLVICRGRDTQENSGQIPYLLTVDEIMAFTDVGLSLESFADYFDQESPPVRRFRAEFKKYSSFDRSLRQSG
ncbi:MAG: class I SAM-dependent methyltransferase [Acaryochloris sp. RU_4_1]|nr:class I SAM-dependent methyltransferase [Acaryochloris sp. RU_4_1]NJR53732.1 class I SAM-dependent methyltransferase [Acaryochloris sp. CRU_2_0]